MREASSSPTTPRVSVSSPTTRRIRWLPIISIATFSVYRLLYYSSDGGLPRSLSDVDNSPRRTIDIEKSYVDDRILTHHREKDTIVEEYQYRREEKTIAGAGNYTRDKFTPTFKNGWIIPNTSFTPYLLTLVDFYKQNYITCQSNMTITGGNGVTLQITTPSAYSTTPPIVKQSVGFKFLKLFQNGFLNNRTLPSDSSITLRVSKKDKDQAEERCFFAASSPGGKHSIYNFQDMKLWVDNTTYHNTLPWNQRQTIPVFRGKMWGMHGGYTNKLQRVFESNIQSNNMSKQEAADIFFEGMLKLPENKHDYLRRFNLVYFSKLHPDVINARLTPEKEYGGPRKRALWENNSTNGLHRVLPFNTIPEEKYYSEYQTHIIMGGYGAAFRTARIFGQGIAVILQDYPYEEWYIHLMKPYVHYIPLAQNISNLNVTLHWVKDNPEKVYQIAQNGKIFYHEYLSYQRMDEFYYELIFRLLLCCG